MVVISYNHGFDIPANEPRRAFYNNPIYPTVVFDGTDVVFEPNPDAYDSVFAGHIRFAKSSAPAYNLMLSGSVTQSNAIVNIKITPVDTIHHESTYAFLAVCEDSLRGILSSSFFYNYVIQQLYSFPISLFLTDSLDTTITFTHTIAPVNLRTVLFVQQLSSQKILQAVEKRFN